MTATSFWLMHAALVGGAFAAFLVVKLLFGHLLIEGGEFDEDTVLAAEKAT
jgi:hypothetical protein